MRGMLLGGNFQVIGELLCLKLGAGYMGIYFYSSNYIY